ncbi:MAG TPA: aldehyde ferredoxin oxidoreductase C-terminal domain-containing protein, partial [Dehalococcoidia bacterium]|nr:aldehyde ferredoxin oxidoreductase C-terminal domain-containing protein [Dehalococcoidia bacterium]
NTRALTKFVTNMPVEEMVNIWAEKTVPFTGDPFMFDYGDGPTGIYSEHKAKLVAWYRRFSVFWLDSVGGCEWRYPRVINTAKPDFRGFTPDLEERVLNAVTGNNKSYAEYMQVGGKILNLDRAIHVLQGRHRDNEKFAPFIFKPKDRDEEEASGMLFPFYQDGKWGRKAMRDRFLVEDRFEEWKTHYYKVEGWDTKSGWPTRSTLEGLGLGHVADVLQARGKLGG